MNLFLSHFLVRCTRVFRFFFCVLRVRRTVFFLLYVYLFGATRERLFMRRKFAYSGNNYGRRCAGPKLPHFRNRIELCGAIIKIRVVKLSPTWANLRGHRSPLRMSSGAVGRSDVDFCGHSLRLQSWGKLCFCVCKEIKGLYTFIQ